MPCRGEVIIQDFSYFEPQDFMFLLIILNNSFYALRGRNLMTKISYIDMILILAMI